MRVEDYLRGDIVAIINCPVRDSCLLASVCGKLDESSVVLYPNVFEVGKGEMLWTNLRYEHRVYVLQSGIFQCLVNAEQGEVPFALYGKGSVLGVAEFYSPKEDADMYHFSALVPGRVCSLPGRAVRKRLENAPVPVSQQVICRSLTNQFAFVATLSKILSRTHLRDKILGLLALIAELLGDTESPIEITHNAIPLLSSGRATTTRVLHDLQNEGRVELGYRSVRLL